MKDFRERIVFRDEEPIYSAPVPFDKSRINTFRNELIKEYKNQYPFSEIEVRLEKPKFFGW